MRQPVQVAIYCARKNEDHWEYLLLRRIPSGGGFWQGVTGGVEGDEEYFTAALRELKEETGFEPNELMLVDYSYHYPVREQWKIVYERPFDIINEVVFLAIVDSRSEPTIDPEEHDAYQWCRYAEAVGKLFWEDNKVSLKYCTRMLEKMAATGRS